MEVANVQAERPVQILFEGAALPASVMKIGALASLTSDQDAELTHWLTSLPNCRGCVRTAPSLHCFTMAARARDAMLDQRQQLLTLLETLPGHSPLIAREIYAEWMGGLQQIGELAARTEEDCEWAAPADPNEAPILTKQVAAMKRYLGEG